MSSSFRSGVNICPRYLNLYNLFSGIPLNDTVVTSMPFFTLHLKDLKLISLTVIDETVVCCVFFTLRNKLSQTTYWCAHEHHAVLETNLKLLTQTPSMSQITYVLLSPPIRSFTYKLKSARELNPLCLTPLSNLYGTDKVPADRKLLIFFP